MTKELTITRAFAASPDRVYAAWTEPEQFSVWFGTENVQVPLDTLKLDVRPGGEIKAVMHLPDGAKIHWAGEYLEVDPAKRIVFTITDNPAEPAGDPITVDIVATGNGSEVTMVQPVNEFDDDGIAALREGYRAFFDDMEKVIARRP